MIVDCGRKKRKSIERLGQIQKLLGSDEREEGIKK